MIHRILSVAAVLFMYCTSATAQQTLYSYQSTGTLDDFTVASVGDSILLSFDEERYEKHAAKSFWISDSTFPDANVDFNVLTSARFGDTVYLYDLHGKSSSRSLTAMVSSNESNTWTPAAASIPLPGTFLGSYVDKNLFVFLLDKTGVLFTRLEISGMSVVDKKTFTLPVNLAAPVEVAPVEFYSGESSAFFSMGRARVKVFHNDSFYITADKGSFTQVMKLDFATGTVTHTEFSAEATPSLSSFICDDKLFQVSLGKKRFLVNVLDLSSHNSIIKSELLATHSEFPVYFRYRRKNIIHHEERFSTMMKLSPLSQAMATVQKKDGQYIIQWGSYYDENGGMGGSGNPVVFIAKVVGTIILQAIEGPGQSRYFNYSWNPQQNTFAIDDPSLQTVHQKIDDYEIAQDVRFGFKAYLPYRQGVAAIYYNARTKNVSVVYFT